MFAAHYALHDHADASMLSEVFSTPGKAHAALAAHLIDLGELDPAADKVVSSLGPEGSSIARVVSFRRDGYGEFCSATIVEVTLAD
jgi:hypothetical protein